MRTTNCTSTSPEATAERPAGWEPAEVDAGLLATVLPFLAEHGLEHPSLDGLLEELGVSRARAAEAAAAVLEQFRLDRLLALCQEMTRFLLDHPGTVEVSPRRRYYSLGYRRFVVDLRRRYGDVDLEQFAHAAGVPREILVRWRGARWS